MRQTIRRTRQRRFPGSRLGVLAVLASACTAPAVPSPAGASHPGVPAETSAGSPPGEDAGTPPETSVEAPATPVAEAPAEASLVQPSLAEPSLTVASAPEPEPAPAVLDDGAVLGALVTSARDAGRATVADVLVADGGELLGVLLRRSEGALSLVDASDLRPGTPHWLYDGALEPAAESAEELFATRERTTIEGRLVEIGASPGGPHVAELKLHETEPNLLHRVRVDAAALVLRDMPELATGSDVEVEGVLTRDARGKLLVASALAMDGRRLELRGPDGDLRWGELARGLVSLRRVNGARVETPEGPVTATGCLLDWREKRVVSFLVDDAEGRERVLGWGALERTADGWRAALPPAVLPGH